MGFQVIAKGLLWCSGWFIVSDCQGDKRLLGVLGCCSVVA